MLRTLVLSLFVAGAVFAFREDLAEALERLLESPPCAEPINYAVGSFDSRFGLSRAEFLEAIAAAEAIWEKPLGKELFAHSPEKAELPINLIYDYRQKVTDSLSVLESDLKQDEALYRSLEKEYLALRDRYQEFESAYEARAALFNQRNASYAEMVENWNRGDRTSQSEFDAIRAAEQALQAELSSIKVLEGELNRMISELNSKAARVNKMGKELNLNVQEYNTIGASRGETFAGGLYSVGPEGQKIDIYEFSSKEKLVRILAHELGHALGLEHVEDPQAIMYRLNEGDKEALSQSDLSALKTLCAVQ